MQTDAVALGDCFMAYRGKVDEDEVTRSMARVGAVRFAQFVNTMIAVNTKKG